MPRKKVEVKVKNQQMTISLPPDLVKRIKILAINLNKSIPSIYQEITLQYLKKHEQPAVAKESIKAIEKKRPGKKAKKAESVAKNSSETRVNDITNRSEMAPEVEKV